MNLADVLIGDPDAGARVPELRMGVVTAVSPLTVRVGSAATAQACHALASYYPTVGDVVSVLVLSGDRLVLGTAAGPRVQAGTSVSTTNASGDAAITFPIAFAAVPSSVIAVSGDPGVRSDLVITIYPPPTILSATGFSFRAWQAATNTAFVGALRINWVASV